MIQIKNTQPYPLPNACPPPPKSAEGDTSAQVKIDQKTNVNLSPASNNMANSSTKNIKTTPAPNGTTVNTAASSASNRLNRLA